MQHDQTPGLQKGKIQPGRDSKMAANTKNSKIKKINFSPGWPGILGWNFALSISGALMFSVLKINKKKNYSLIWTIWKYILTLAKFALTLALKSIQMAYFHIKNYLYKILSKYSRLLLSRNRRNPQTHFEISVLRHIRFVVLRKKQFGQPNFTKDYAIRLV